jgi:hypothetical protein
MGLPTVSSHHTLKPEAMRHAEFVMTVARRGNFRDWFSKNPENHKPSIALAGTSFD